jgi:lipopolysaccharide/colanic/teichoic acid biosynthesis glycosyltransferase
MLSDVFGDLMPRPRAAEFGAHPALTFGVVHHSRSALWFKRVIDVLFASTLLVITAPVLALAALAIKLDSPGPVLFRQKRCGLNGRVFDVLKLRSMSADAEKRRGELIELNEMDGPVFKIRNDPRVTRVGRWLRRLSIDEVPQLWNVLRGEMSVVGPRPPVPSEVAKYEAWQRRRLSVRPGLTCICRNGQCRNALRWSCFYPGTHYTLGGPRCANCAPHFAYRRRQPRRTRTAL